MWKATKGYETALFPAIAAGAAKHGDVVEQKTLEEFVEPEGDLGLIIGVVRREVLWAYQKAGIPILYMDKGYVRERMAWRDLSIPKWWRMCWNDTHPTAYLTRKDYPNDRAQAAHVVLQERATTGDDILILGSSQKFHHTHGIAHPTEWVDAIVEQLREVSLRRIVYRPKPSWKWAVQVKGAEFDHGAKRPIEEALAHAHVTITYGSIAGVDSICAGVPCIVLGNSVAAPVSAFNGWSRTAIQKPFWATTEERVQWISNLCYHQWTPIEIEDGTAWGFLKEQMCYAV